MRQQKWNPRSRARHSSLRGNQGLGFNVPGVGEFSWGDINLIPAAAQALFPSGVNLNQMPTWEQISNACNVIDQVDADWKRIDRSKLNAGAKSHYDKTKPGADFISQFAPAMKQVCQIGGQAWSAVESAWSTIQAVGEGVQDLWPFDGGLGAVFIPIIIIIAVIILILVVISAIGDLTSPGAMDTGAPGQGAIDPATGLPYGQGPGAGQFLPSPPPPKMQLVPGRAPRLWFGDPGSNDPTGQSAMHGNQDPLAYPVEDEYQSTLPQGNTAEYTAIPLAQDIPPAVIDNQGWVMYPDQVYAGHMQPPVNLRPPLTTSVDQLGMSVKKDWWLTPPLPEIPLIPDAWEQFIGDGLNFVIIAGVASLVLGSFFRLSGGLGNIL